MNVFRRITWLVASIGLFAFSAHAATWTKIDVPGSSGVDAAGINNLGDITGSYSDKNGHFHGFLLRGGVITSLDVPDALYTMAVGINDSGWISGEFRSADQNIHGFVFDGQSYVTLNFPGALDTHAAGINNAKEVVGWYILPGDPNHTHGFKWGNGTFITVDPPNSLSTVLFAISNREQIVGAYSDSQRNSGDFLMNAQDRFRYFNSPSYSGLPGVNVRKMLVGYDNSGYGVLLNVTTGAMTRKRHPGNYPTSFAGINDNGDIVGAYLRGKLYGFVWVK